MLQIIKISINQMMIALITLVAIMMFALMIMVWKMSTNITDKLETLTQFKHITLMVKDIRYHTVQVQQFFTDAALTKDRSGVSEATKHFNDAKDLFNQLVYLLPDKKNNIENATQYLNKMVF